MGRPSSFTDTIGAEICSRIAAGETLIKICRDSHMPYAQTVREWVLADRNGFAASYAHARELQYEHWADEIVEIGESVQGEQSNAAVSAAKLAADNRKWLLSKLASRRYGDKLEMTGAGGQPLLPANAQSADRAGHMLAVIARAAQSNRAAKQIEHDPARKDDGEPEPND